MHLQVPLLKNMQKYITWILKLNSQMNYVSSTDKYRLRVISTEITLFDFLVYFVKNNKKQLTI